ncbi:hypothetical protein TNIN_367381 [Trichonephila inaurata madagascariensis]|uniref:DDE-1 domain-containing protein n=1 Tax=Trichonephila inaurata madagascariensis TaxID=2747483 RepID=A0A8X6WN70_9ARAC|nr:hypothetical protein TNIN_367381 [Trichonephila inaurata madagascariensis]
MGEGRHYISSGMLQCRRKEPRKVLFISDSHTSHCSDVAVLYLAAENEATLICLASHFTWYLQPISSCSTNGGRGSGL